MWSLPSTGPILPFSNPLNLLLLKCLRLLILTSSSFNPLTAPGNAEVQVADSPDGRTYAYLAGWSEMHIVDVTNPANTTVTGVYVDPNTQVLDVKYLEYNGREYIICLLYTSPSPRDRTRSRMPSSA